MDSIIAARPNLLLDKPTTKSRPNGEARLTSLKREESSCPFLIQVQTCASAYLGITLAVLSVHALSITIAMAITEQSKIGSIKSPPELSMSNTVWAPKLRGDSLAAALSAASLG